MSSYILCSEYRKRLGVRGECFKLLVSETVMVWSLKALLIPSRIPYTHTKIPQRKGWNGVYNPGTDQSYEDQASPLMGARSLLVLVIQHSSQQQQRSEYNKDRNCVTAPLALKDTRCGVCDNDSSKKLKTRRDNLAIREDAHGLSQWISYIQTAKEEAWEG